MKSGSKSPSQKTATVHIRLTPRSARDEIVGREGETYRIKVKAPPLDGRANKALTAFLSKRLGTAKRNIEIRSGEKSREKTVEILGMSKVEVDSILEACILRGNGN